MTASNSPFVYDLLSHMRRDASVHKRVTAAAERLSRVIQLQREGKANRSDVAQAMANMIPVCGFNFGLLIPHFFPNYPVGRALSLIQRPFMFAMTCMAPDSITTLMAGRQVGKCAVGDTKVHSDQGDVTLRELFLAGEPVGQRPSAS